MPGPQGGTPKHYLYVYVPPNGVVILKLLIQNGYPFQRHFLEWGIKFRTHESSSFVSSHLKLVKDKLLLKIRFNALTSKLLYSCCTLERSIKNWPISRMGYQFQGEFQNGVSILAEIFLERGAKLESREADTHPKNTQVPPRGPAPRQHSWN